MSQTYRVLTVEDDEFIVRLLQMTLGNLCVLEWAPTAELGLARLQVSPPIDLVLLDLLLPNGEGQRLVDRFIKLASHIPIVVLTGHQFDESAMLASGVHAILHKPGPSPDLIFRTIRDAIAAHKTRVDFASIDHHIDELKEDLKSSAKWEGEPKDNEAY